MAIKGRRRAPHITPFQRAAGSISSMRPVQTTGAECLFPTSFQRRGVERSSHKAISQGGRGVGMTTGWEGGEYSRHEAIAEEGGAVLLP